MKEELFNQLLQSLQEADAIVKGKAAPAKITRFPKLDIPAVRKKLGITQAEFAQMVGVSLGTLRNWEQGRRRPNGPARVLLLVVSQDPHFVRKVLLDHLACEQSWANTDNILKFVKPVIVLPSQDSSHFWDSSNQALTTINNYREMNNDRTTSSA